MRWMIPLLLVMFSLPAVSQERVRGFEVVVQEAQQMQREKAYAKAVPLYLESLKFPEAAEWTWALHYNLSCCYAHLGNGRKALSHLEQSVATGNTDYHLINTDPDLAPLKKMFPEKFRSVVRKIEAAESAMVRARSPLAFLEYDTYVGSTDITRHLWDDFHHPLMDSLRRTYGLAEIVKTGRTEFDSMKILLNWVATRWKHSGDHTCSEQNALAILAAAERGERFACVDYSTVLTQCLIALGYPARSMGIMKRGVAVGGGKGHRCTEVWSNQYQKWILLDGQNNAWWESGGIPLSAQECRHLVVTERENELTFVGQHAHVDYASLRPTWSAYFHHVWFPWDNTFFERPPQTKDRSCEFLADGVTPELFSEGWALNLPVTDQVWVAYPALNQVAIRLTVHRGGPLSDTVAVSLSHTAPFFEKILVCLNGSNWEASEMKFPWALRPGVNTIEARTLNQGGIYGRVSRLLVLNNIPTLAEPTPK